MARRSCLGPPTVYVVAAASTRSRSALEPSAFVTAASTPSGTAQVGSYRVIVSNETPQLEEFSLCILQQNNCFQSDAPILSEPRVPVMTSWRGRPVDDAAARSIFVGHLDAAETAVETRRPWSWKIVVGANPAYDAFPMQHQIFYPASKGSGLWYDPVCCAAR